MATKVEVYFLYTLEFDVGEQHIRLYGVILESSEGLSFALSNNIALNPQLFPPDQVTTSITEPFGMTGVVLENLGIAGNIHKDKTNNNKTAADITLTATARFLKLNNFSLSGTIVFEKTLPRLVLVTLSVDKPLTMTDLVKYVIGGTWDSGDKITDQFAFQSGEMYYLNPPDPAPDNYTFSYLDQSKKEHEYSPGYHLDATLQIFQKYKFDISLDVEGNEITLSTTVPEKIDFDFATLVDTKLEISTKSLDKYFRISTKLTILTTPIHSEILAKYDFNNHYFSGSISVKLDSLSLPQDIKNTSKDVTLSIEFTWTQASGSNSGFKITNLDGLPINTLDLIQKYLKVFNEFSSQGCEEIIEDWLKDLIETSLTPELNGSPSKTEDGNMRLPLKITYEIKAGNSSIASSEINFDAIFAIPHSLKDLPRAMWQSIVDSSEQIAVDILKDPDTYKAIALKAARLGGAKAFARFICRALEKGLENLAKALAEAAKGVIAETLVDAVALAGMLIAVSLLEVTAVVKFLEGILDKIKSLFTGKNTEEEEAKKQIGIIRDQVESYISHVDQLITQIKETIKIQHLETTLDEDKKFVAKVSPKAVRDGELKLESEGKLSFTFQLLSGEARDVKGQTLYEKQNQIFPVVKSWSEIPNNSEYRMNASVKSILSGFPFLNQQTEESMTDAISQLKGINNGVATDFADYLQGKLDEFKSYNTDGIQSEWVYSDSPNYTTVGKSYIGINTRIKTGQK